MIIKEYRNELRYKSETPMQWTDKRAGAKHLLQVANYYNKKGYVPDYERLCNEIILKIEKYEYINCGCGEEENWKYNKHNIFINGYKFAYRTGVGIDLLNGGTIRGFAQEKIIIDCLLNLVHNYYSVKGLDMDEFIEELGYTSTLKMVRQGEQIYREIKENNKKLVKILSYNTIDDINDIIAL